MEAPPRLGKWTYTLIEDNNTMAVNTERQTERLATIIRGFLEDGCPLDAPWNDACPDPARHLAQEIVERRIAWE